MSRAGMVNGASEVDATLSGTERGPRHKSLASLLGTMRQGIRLTDTRMLTQLRGMRGGGILSSRVRIGV